MSYEMHFGSIPSGMEVCHRCDVMRCVNPAHLFIGTHTENVRDCAAKGRMSAGQGILSLPDIPPIVRRLAAGELHRSIAKDYGVCVGAITSIAVGKNWRVAQGDPCNFADHIDPCACGNLQLCLRADRERISGRRLGRPIYKVWCGACGRLGLDARGPDEACRLWNSGGRGVGDGTS